MSTRFAHRLTGIRILEGGALVRSTPERTAWAKRVNRAYDGGLPTFEVNDVVTDGDLHSPHYGKEFVVLAVAGNMLTLEDTEWGSVRLTNVHRTFFEHAGRRWLPRVCTCARYMRRESDGRCMNYHCPAKTL